MEDVWQQEQEQEHVEFAAVAMTEKAKEKHLPPQRMRRTRLVQNEERYQEMGCELDNAVVAAPVARHLHRLKRYQEGASVGVWCFDLVHEIGRQRRMRMKKSVVEACLWVAPYSQVRCGFSFGNSAVH